MRIRNTAFTCGLALIGMSGSAVAAAPSGSAPAQPEYHIQEVCACDRVAMNAFGQVTGSTVVPGGESHAFLWDPITEQLRDIGTLGGNGSIGRAINDKGQITGDAADSDGNSHAFFWDPATDLMEDLGTLGGANSSGVDINEAGQIAGTSDAPGDFYPERHDDPSVLLGPGHARDADDRTPFCGPIPNSGTSTTMGSAIATLLRSTTRG